MTSSANDPHSLAQSPKECRQQSDEVYRPFLYFRAYNRIPVQQTFVVLRSSVQEDMRGLWNQALDTFA